MYSLILNGIVLANNCSYGYWSKVDNKCIDKCGNGDWMQDQQKCICYKDWSEIDVTDVIISKIFFLIINNISKC
jgi:hypothetical protein